MCYGAGMPTTDRRRSRIGRLIETGRTDEATNALLAAARGAVASRSELARSIGVTRQTVARWSRVLDCRDALDDALYAVDRRPPDRRPHGDRPPEAPMADEGAP